VRLDALLEEAHVSRAPHRLNLSQPAVSSALRRCRDLFDDALLERGRGMMRRTPRAEALRGPLRTLLDDVQALVEPEDVPARELRRVVRVLAADDPTLLIAGPLLTSLSRSAPGLTIVFHPWSGTDSSGRALVDGDDDLAISALPDDRSGLERITLIHETYVVAMRENHPAAEHFDLDAWLAWPHILVSGRGETRSPLDAQLAERGRSRTIGVVVPSFQMLPPLLKGSDLIAMVPRHGLAMARHSDLVSFDPPIDVPGFPLRLAWHSRQSQDRGVLHVIEAVREIFQALVR
jgi:DNA-binding transcriptional LysR family regulator